MDECEDSKTCPYYTNTDELEMKNTCNLLGDLRPVIKTSISTLQLNYTLYNCALSFEYTVNTDSHIVRHAM